MSESERFSRIEDLVRALRDAERELQTLTGVPVDAVASEGSEPFLLVDAQQRLRRSEAAQRQLAEQQFAILNALPAHIALVDSSGTIISVNEAWRRFAQANVLEGADFGVGLNYLAICDAAMGDCSDEAGTAAEGIRRVIRGELPQFGLEYPCHSATARRWFRLMVTPLNDGRPGGVVVMHVNVTERRLAEERLRESLARSVEAERIAQLGSWEMVLLDLEHLSNNALTVSDELLRIAGVEPGTEPPTVADLARLISPEARDELCEALRTAIRERRPYSVVHRVTRPDGTERVIQELGRCFFDDATGRPLKLVGTAHDITERTRAEQELARMNRALRLLSNCNVALVRAQSEQELLDQVCRIAIEDGGYLLAWVGYAEDDAAKTISVRASAGANRDYLDGLRLSWSPDVPEGGGPAGRTVRSGELVASSDITADADFVFWRDRAVASGIRSVLCFPLRDASRTLGVLALFSAEVSTAGSDELQLLQKLADDLAFGIVGQRARAEHHRAEQQLREQAALLDQASEAIFVRDLDDRITYWNRGAERLYGWTAAEVVGRRAAELFHRTDAARLAQARSAQEHVIATGAWGAELLKFDKSGRSRLIAARWSLLCDAMGQPRAVLTLNTDVTEKRALEAQLLRTQRLESIGTLAGGIAHDLNNVLTPILSSIALLSEGETSSERLDDLAALETAARRGAAMVRQLLAFARGEPQELRKHVDVVVIAREVLKMVGDTFPKDISSVLRTIGARTTIHGDPTQVHQLLTNLCVNARDAMPNGGVLTLAIEGVVIDDLYAGMSADTPPGTYLRVRVEDTGSGMTPEIRDRIFEPFFTTKPLGKGTGLGLSTCHAIARNHGGFILVSSELGNGSRFDVYLPAEIPTGAPRAAESARADLPTGRGELVLIVDDEEAIRKITRRTLERYGYQVIVAANGAEAIALYAANAGSIAAVITDMSMPIMDGPATILALQAIDPSVRIIGSTGLDADGKAMNARTLGVIHWVPKPYSADVLLRMLRTVIG